MRARNPNKKRDTQIAKQKYRAANKERIAATNHAWWLANRAYVRRENEARRVKKLYNMTLEEVAQMKRRQQNRCAICQHIVDRLCVDHCHVSGLVRGGLCHKCNSGLGMFGDNLMVLEAATKYMRDWQQVLRSLDAV